MPFRFIILFCNNIYSLHFEREKQQQQTMSYDSIGFNEPEQIYIQTKISCVEENARVQYINRNSPWIKLLRCGLSSLESGRRSFTTNFINADSISVESIFILFAGFS